MAFTKEDRILIKGLRQEKIYNALRFLKEFAHKHWCRSSLFELIAQIDATGSAERKKNPGSGRSRTARKVENVSTMEELVAY